MAESSEHPRQLRVAIVGSGPAGFYAAQALQAKSTSPVSIDMFDRLPTPFGLVRLGVAPDHGKIKKVTAVYEKIAAAEGFRFYGNVEYGRDLGLSDLRRHYDAVIFSTGAQTDRRLGIPGEDLEGSHPATEFVAWYNGHPDFADYRFNLDAEAAVVIGVGNVAVDVARVLSRSTDELARTDIADPALAALRASRVRKVHLLGRRGPAQAAFTNPEAKELGQLDGVAAIVRDEELALDPVSAKAVEEDRKIQAKLDLLQALPRAADKQPRELHLRFLVSPVELLDDGRGRVGAVRVVRNRLVPASGGRLRAEATEQTETIPAGLVFRSVGYRGVPLADVPFREDWGIVPNADGRVTDGVDGPTLPGLYVAGWIKRGPSGVIGTNKPDAVETVGALLEDLAAGGGFQPDAPQADAIDRLLERCAATPIRYDDWRRLDRMEVERGQAAGRPRVKFTTRQAVRDALGH